MPSTPRARRHLSPTWEAGVYVERFIAPSVSAALSPSRSPGHSGVAGDKERLHRIASAVDNIGRALATAAAENDAPAEGPRLPHFEGQLSPGGFAKALQQWKAKLAAAESEAAEHRAEASAAWEDAFAAAGENDYLHTQLAEARAEILELRERLEAAEAALREVKRRETGVAGAGLSPEVRRVVALRRSARLLHGTVMKAGE